MEAYDVIIAGGGVLGLAAAYFCASAGLRVLVLERESIASQASGAAAGILTPVGESAQPGPLADLMVRSLEFHRSFTPRLKELTGIDPLFGPLTVLVPAFSPEEAGRLRALAEHLAGRNARIRWAEPAELLAAEPRLNPDVRGGLLAEGEGQADAYRLTLALGRAAELAGAEIRYAGVKGLEAPAGGRPRVITDSGAAAAEFVVLAMGPWTALAGPWLGLPVPVEPLRGQLLRLKLEGPPLAYCVMYGDHYVLSKLDGLVTAGTTEELVGFDPSTTRAARDFILEGVLRLVPGLADAELVNHTACLRPLAADDLPILGPVPGRERVILATGHGRNGILMGPYSGRLVAEVILGRTPEIDLGPFSPARFREARPVRRRAYRLFSP
jgi:glycine oxidase